MFVEATGDEDPDVRQASVVEHLASPAGERVEIATVETYSGGLLQSQLMDHVDGVLDADDGVVGIDEEGRQGGQVLREGPERLSLGRKRLDIAVGHRSHGLKAVETGGLDVAGAGKTDHD